MAQHPMKVVLLDLDGTLTKSDGGIIGSVIKTFEEIGRPVPDAAELRRFIGPAIIESLRRNHVPAEDLDRAVDITAATTETVPCSTIRTSPATRCPDDW